MRPQFVIQWGIHINLNTGKRSCVADYNLDL